MLKKCLNQVRITIPFILFIAISITTYAAQIDDKIELSPIRATMPFVEDGNIIEEYRGEFIARTGVHGNIQNWQTFKDNLDSKQKRGIAGEVAAKFFFEALGYQILEGHYNARMESLNAQLGNGNGIFEDEQCTTKKGPDNGIDGLFILQDETIEDHSHIVINEAKFRGNQVNLLKTNFGFVAGGIQQSHSNWNRPRFSWPSCLPGLNYDEETIIRTATLLDRDGILKFYEVRDRGSEGRIVGEYASEAPKGWNIRKAYDLQIVPKLS